MKKLLSLALALSMLALSMVSCGDSADSPTGKDAESTNIVAGNEDETAAETVVGVERANLPDMNYDGADFIFLNGVNSAASVQSWQSLNFDDQVGEPLHDAIYLRNRKIESLYGVKIKNTIYEIKSDSQTEISKSINAGDKAFDAMMLHANMLISMARENYLADYNDMTYINTSAAWWDQSVVEGLTICDQLYLCTGDISPFTNARVYTIVFNKDMCRELGLDLPYQSVFDGTWTLDKFNYYISNVNSDINGDSKMDYDDRWGFFSQNGCGYMMYFSGGGKVTDLVDGLPELSYNSEMNVNLANTALSIAIDETRTVMANPLVAANGNNWQAASTWFANGGSLMRSSVFEPVPRDYRAMETDFGVLPYPKLDEKQDRYYTLPELSSFMIAFPTTCDREFSSLIVEALAAESTYTVTEVFYETCLNEKSVRDEESKQILKIIFSSKIFDIGYFTNIGGLVSQLNSLENAKKTDVASTFEKIGKLAQKELDLLIEDFEKLAEAK